MLFGKTMESLRKRMNLELVTNPTHAKKFIAKPTTLHWDIISDNLVSVRKQKPKIISVRPIYLGFCILELSKITMCKLHYEKITDSSISHIQTPDLYKDMADNLDTYDTFDYTVDHPFTQR